MLTLASRCACAAALALLALFSGCQRVDGPLPVLAWIGPPPNETTAARYAELAEAGFTHSLTFQPSAEAMVHALDVAHAEGIKLLVHCPELRSDPEATVLRFRDHPANAGYYLRDEPGAGEFAELAAWARRIEAVDPDRFCYINLFPNYASEEQLGVATYREHVERFLDEVPVRILSFDHYPVIAAEDGVTLRPEWYENLEIIRDAASEAGIPFWAFALSVAHDPYPIPELAHLRLQLYSNLAYGAQGLQHFTYWTPESDLWNFHSAPIEADGTRTPVYDRVRQVNAEVQALAGAFVGCRAVQVGHTGEPLPRGARAYAPRPPIRSLDTGGGNAVAAELARGRDRFLVIVNRDLHGDLDFQLAWAPTARIARHLPGGVRDPIQGNSVSGRIAPGGVAIYQWRARGR